MNPDPIKPDTTTSSHSPTRSEISTTPLNDAAQNPADEPTNSKLSVRSRVRQHLIAEVNTKHAYLVMAMCCFTSGLVDSTIYNAYGTFVSMQTGNTIFVGLGSSLGHNTNKPYGWVKSLTSIVCFTLGAFFFSRLCRWLAPLRRGTLSFSFLIQALIIIITATIIEVGVIDGSVSTAASREIQWTEEIPIALLSFQSAGQIVGSRILKVVEIPSVVVTSVLCDFASDPNLLSPPMANGARNRRVMAFSGILVGAVVGGWAAKAMSKIEPVIWLAAAIKLLIAGSWAVWPERREATAIV